MIRGQGPQLAFVSLPVSKVRRTLESLKFKSDKVGKIQFQPYTPRILGGNWIMMGKNLDVAAA
jgi:hypothetical protein